MKTALVVGGAACVWEDLARARKLFEPDFTVLINDIGVFFPRYADLWVSYHPELLEAWALKRAKHNLPPVGKYGAGHPNAAPTFATTYHCKGGSSGMLGAWAALKEESTHVVLAGVPMDPSMSHFHNKKHGKPWVDGEHYLQHWLENEEKFRGRVKSLSGWTAEFLGQPTTQWLESDV